MTPTLATAIVLILSIVLFAGITWRHIEAVRAYERGEL